jgi:hypothetical protein
MPRRIPTNLVTTIVVLAAASAGYAGLRWVWRASFPEETTSVAAYASTLKQWSSTGLVSHFPPSIPPNARNVHFAALPKFLQGGAYIQLRMQLPASEIAAIRNQLKNATSQVYKGGEKTSFPTTDFRTSDDPKTTFEFPNHFDLYVLSAKDRSGDWNHGQTSGAAISTTTNEVVYWADYW